MIEREMTEQEKLEQKQRLSAYADARLQWHARPKDWAPEVKTAAYERLTSLWFSLRKGEMKVAGTEARFLYH